MDAHLNESQIEALLQPELEPDRGVLFDAESYQEAKAHLDACDSCRERFRLQESAMERLVHIKSNTPNARGPQCPPDEVWIEIAAGIQSQLAEMCLNHAVKCDHCGPLLSQAAADLAETLTPEEESRIAGLSSSTLEGQRALASKLGRSRTGGAGARGDATGKRKWFRAIFSPIRMATATLVIVLMIGGFWLANRLMNDRSPEQLIANAYGEKRMIEMRIEGAPYAPLRQERSADSAQSRMTRPALLSAEAEIARQLESHPESVRWLQASGRASMLEADAAGVEAAVLTLEKAKRLAPEDASVSVDLASAYFERGLILDREVDYASAVEILQRLKASHQGGETAQFNLAIALEKIPCKADAAAEWQTFLTQYPKSPWVPEAQRHLSEIRKQICLRHERSDSPLKTLEQTAAAFADRKTQTIAEIDERIEEYQDVAIKNWLPQLFAADGADRASAGRARKALEGIAQLLSSQHSDFWLSDILKADRQSSMVAEAVHMLAEGAAKIETSDELAAQRAASRAAALFDWSKVPAGRRRAQLVLVLAKQYEHRAAPCESMAQEMLRDPELKRDAWIHAQVLLEESLCASVPTRQALDAVQTALDAATVHRFPTLVLRADAAEAGFYAALGDTDRALDAAAKGLRAYWAGTYPKLRGYNALVAFDEINYPRDQWFLEAAILREAMPMVEDDPRTSMVAVEESRLGQALMHMGEFDEAERSYQRVEQLLVKSAPGLQRTSLRAEAELGFTKVDLSRNRLSACLDRIDRIRPIFEQLPDDFLDLDFYQTSGIAELRANRLDQAKYDLETAVGLAEKGLRNVETESDRWTWNHQTEPIYRAITELKLRSNAEQAWIAWESYKGAALRGRSIHLPSTLANRSAFRAPSQDLTSAPNIPEGVLVSYMSLPGGFVVWAWDRGSVRQQWVAVNEDRLVELAGRFAEHCSDPRSDRSALRSEGAELYRMVLLPIEPWIAGHRRFVFEPDGVLKTVPIGLLVDGAGEYLADRFDLSISPGVAYLNEARAWGGVSSSSNILLFANPQVVGWSPLPDVEQEAQGIASLFMHPSVVSQQPLSVPDFASRLAQADLFHFSGHAQISVASAGLVTGMPAALDYAQFDTIRSGHIQIAVLSACSSSRGTAGQFDDEDSLVRRFMGAHVPVVVASRWTVDSAATASLMRAFYASLLAGTPPAKSLALAMRTVRARPEFAHPYYWAGFTVFGLS